MSSGGDGGPARIRQGRRLDERHLEFRHRRRDEEPAARACHQSRPPRRPRDARAVGGDAGVRVHLPVELRDQHERHARLERPHASRPLPDRATAVEAVPGRPACRGGSRRPTSRDAACRPSAAAPPESASTASAGRRQRLRIRPRRSHFAKSMVPGNGVSMTNCAKVTPGALRQLGRRRRTCRACRSGRPKMNEPSTWTP